MSISRGRYGDIAALMAGAVLVLAFSPFNFFPLALLSPVALFVLWRDASAQRAAWRGFLFGLGLFAAGVSWVYVSLHNFGNMPAPLAAFAVLLFVVVLALYPALMGFVQAKFSATGARAHALFVLPALWVLCEWLRGWLFTGFPWLNLGYSQADTVLAGYASWLGVYGVSFACAVSAGLITHAWFNRRQVWRFCVPLLLFVWVLGWLAGRIDWARPIDGTLRVALVQANVPLAIKWVPAYRSAIVEQYFNLTRQAKDAELVVWPEAAIPGYLDQFPPNLREELADLARGQHADFLIGVIERDNDTQRYYNSVIGIGARDSVYRKRHLVPFGEFLPLAPLFGWLIDYLDIPMSDFNRGADDQPPVTAAGQPVAISVCYEDAFGEELVRALPQATLIVNVSEDAWFGASLAPHQRIQMARLRALESARPMVRAANTGPSVIIDHRGRVSARSPQFESFVLTGVVQPMAGATPYVRFGNWPVVSALALGLLFLLPWRQWPRRG